MIALVAFAQWLLAGPQLADAAVLIALYWVALDGSFAEDDSPPGPSSWERSWRRCAGRRRSR